jgi:hypothetical protein
MRAETSNPTITPPPLTVVENPYLKVRIDAKDHHNLIYSEFDLWDRGANFDTETFWYRRWIGLKASNSSSSGNLLGSWLFPRDGWYHIRVLAFFHPTYTGGFQLYDGNTPIESFKSQQSPWAHTGLIEYKPYYFKGGIHTFTCTVTNPTMLAHMIITPVFRFEGDNQDNNYTNGERLNINKAEFTQNSVNEVNTLTMSSLMDEKYYTDYEDNNSILKFDFSDVITIWLGNDYKTTRPMWGGYLTSWEINEDGLDISGLDRMYDLNRQAVFQNFAIAGGANSGTKALASFASVYELGRYLTTCADHTIPPYFVPYNYAFFNNMGNEIIFNSLDVGVWDKTWDMEMGNPKPCMKLYAGEYSIGSAYATLFNDTTNPYDVASYEYFAFDYYFGGGGGSLALEFNVEFTIHKTGETINEAEIYTVYFTGGETIKKPIGGSGATYNGQWNRFNINLKALLDNYCSPSIDSANYYVSKIQFTGTLSESDSFRKRRVVWIDNIVAYKAADHAPKYASTEVKTHYEALKDLCEKTQHVAYVEYGDTRPEDYLIMMEEKWTSSIATIDEENNLISLDTVNMAPLEDDFGNTKFLSYNNPDGTYNMAPTFDWLARAHYGSVDSQEMTDIVDNQIDAEKMGRDWIDSNAYPKTGFSLTIKGDGGLLPLQYTYTNLPSHRLIGNYQVKSITHTYEEGGSPAYKTTVDFGRSGQRFRNIVRGMKAQIKELNNKGSQIGYRNAISEKYGVSGYGAFNTM